MKLCRFGAEGNEKPGLVDAEGRLRDLSAHVGDIGPDQLLPESLAKIAAIDPASLPLVEGDVRYGACVAGTRQFIAIGLNYVDHAHESNLPIPEEPVMFTKGVSTIQGPTDDVVIPRGSVKTDWEVELGVVIGKGGSYIEEANALDHAAPWPPHGGQPRAGSGERGLHELDRNGAKRLRHGAIGLRVESGRREGLLVDSRHGCHHRDLDERDALSRHESDARVGRHSRWRVAGLREPVGQGHRVAGGVGRGEEFLRRGGAVGPLRSRLPVHGERADA